MHFHPHAIENLLGGPAGLAFNLLSAVMFVTVLAEWLWRTRLSDQGYDLMGAGVSLAVAAGNLLAGGVTAMGVGAVYALVWAWTPLRWPLDDWRTWAAGFVIVEFAYYWFHRWSHEIRWLWASHSVHHSPNEMTVLSAIRLGWTGLISAGWLVYLPVIALGFDPRLVAIILAIDLRYQFFLHTEAVGRLGPLEWVLNTPSHHRVHHGSNPAYLDSNYGGMVIVFDRLFGTFAAERDDDPVRYGLVHPQTSTNPFVVALSEWAALARDLFAARDLRSAWRAAFGRPA